MWPEFYPESSEWGNPCPLRLRVFSAQEDLQGVLGITERLFVLDLPRPNYDI
jgi:hypothetical protein